MKRFVLISIFLHAVVLALLVSWEIPMANRLLPRSVVEVSLIDRIEGKEGGQEKKAEKKPGIKPGKKTNIRDKKDAGATHNAPGVIAPSKEETKSDEPNPEKIGPEPKEAGGEEPKPKEKFSPEPPALRAGSEEPPLQQAGPTPPGDESAELQQSMSPLNKSPGPGGRGEGGAVFFASAGPESGQGGIPLAAGGQGSGTGTGPGQPFRFGNVSRSPGDGDSVVAEIMRRIEKAKLYPRMARRTGKEGKATVRFRIKPDGKVEEAEIIESSGSEILDQASLETVQRAAPLPYKEGWLKVVIVFKML